MKMIKPFFHLLLWTFLPVAAIAQTRISSVTATQKFRLYDRPVPAPTASFLTESGRKVSLENFKGKIVLLNVWTTSCPQCVVELPMLDALQKDMGGMKFQVVALSSDMEPVAALRRFWNGHGLKNLRIYSDTQAFFSKAANVKGLPTTFLIDERGREVGRIRGMAEWDGPVIKAQIRDLIRNAKENAAKEQSAREKTPPPSPVEPSPAAESVPPPPKRPAEEMRQWFK